MHVISSPVYDARKCNTYKNETLLHAHEMYGFPSVQTLIICYAYIAGGIHLKYLVGRLC